MSKHMYGVSLGSPVTIQSLSPSSAFLPPAAPLSSYSSDVNNHMSDKTSNKISTHRGSSTGPDTMQGFEQPPVQPIRGYSQLQIHSDDSIEIGKYVDADINSIVNHGDDEGIWLTSKYRIPDLYGPRLQFGSLQMLENASSEQLLAWARSYGGVKKSHPSDHDRKKLKRIITNPLDWEARIGEWLRERCRLYRVCGHALDANKSQIVAAIRKLPISKQWELAGFTPPAAIPVTKEKTVEEPTAPQSNLYIDQFTWQDKLCDNIPFELSEPIASAQDTQSYLLTNEEALLIDFGEDMNSASSDSRQAVKSSFSRDLGSNTNLADNSKPRRSQYRQMQQDLDREQFQYGLLLEAFKHIDRENHELTATQTRLSEEIELQKEELENLRRDVRVLAGIIENDQSLIANILAPTTNTSLQRTANLQYQTVTEEEVS